MPARSLIRRTTRSTRPCRPCDAQRVLYTAYSVLAPASAAVSCFHGYRRNRGSLGWGIAWFFFGAAFPVFAPTIAVAQGYAEPKQKQE